MGLQIKGSTDRRGAYSHSACFVRGCGHGHVDPTEAIDDPISLFFTGDVPDYSDKDNAVYRDST